MVNACEKIYIKSGITKEEKEEDEQDYLAKEDKQQNLDYISENKSNLTLCLKSTVSVWTER